jgi:hypothetical protein
VNNNPLGLPVITSSDPFLTVRVSGLDLDGVPQVSVVTTLSVSRVQYCGSTNPPTPPLPALAVYAPLEVNTPLNSLIFVMDSLVLNSAGGMYRGDLVYLGNYIGHMDFIYDKCETEVKGIVDV